MSPSLTVLAGKPFSPASIPNLIARFPANAGLFQDTGATTPALVDGSTVTRRNSTVGTAYAVASAGSATLRLNALGSSLAGHRVGGARRGGVGEFLRL
jgi:hypothetical protein